MELIDFYLGFTNNVVGTQEFTATQNCVICIESIGLYSLFSQTNSYFEVELNKVIDSVEENIFTKRIAYQEIADSGTYPYYSFPINDVFTSKTRIPLNVGDKIIFKSLGAFIYTNKFSVSGYIVPQ